MSAWAATCPPKHPLALLVGAHAPEDVDLDGLEVEQLDEEVEGVAHRSHPGRLRRYGGSHVARPTSDSPTASCGARPPPPTRSRAATSTTTGGASSTRPGSGMRRAERRRLRLVAPLARGHRPGGRRSASTPTASRSSGAGSSPRTASCRVAALDHYRRQCVRCRELGLVPVVTFHHFTIPRWLADRGGWEARRRRPALRPLLRAGRRRTWATWSAGRAPSTSPTSWRMMGYLVGRLPPGRDATPSRRRR